MKIYNREEFMKLPEGTIFTSGEPYAFLNLLIKGETWEVDFLESSLLDIDSFSSDENSDRMNEMKKNGTSYEINKSFGREGLFDDKMLYMVFEKKDLEYMIKRFKYAMLNPQTEQELNEFKIKYNESHENYHPLLEDAFFPPPWDLYQYPEKTEGWIEFQRAMRKDPDYYLKS